MPAVQKTVRAFHGVTRAQIKRCILMCNRMIAKSSPLALQPPKILLTVPGVAGAEEVVRQLELALAQRVPKF